MKKRIVLLVALSTGISATAQDKTQKIEDIHLKGKFFSTPYSGINESTTVITRQQIQSAPAVSIEELLQQFAGLDIRRRGAHGVQSDVSLRGGTFEQTLILLNGVRLNDAQTGHNSMNLPVSMDMVERIEVIKGPAARRFGNNAYSGVINIITTQDRSDRAKISAQAGDYSTWQLGASASLSGESASHQLHLQRAGSEGYRYNTDYEISSAFYRTAVNLSSVKMNLQAGFSEKKFGANGFYATPSATEQYEEVQASVVSLGLEKNIGNVQLSATGFWRRGQDMYLYNRNRPEIYRNMHIGHNLGGEFNASFTSLYGRSGVGVELRRETLQSNNLGERSRSVAQVFVEHEMQILKNLTLSPGISWAHFKDQGSFFYPGIDLGLRLSSKDRLYANVGRVHRVPTFTDLYYTSMTETGNAALEPEKATSYELGYRRLDNGMQLRTSVFLRKTTNGIDWVKDSAQEKWRAENIAAISTQGVELDFRHRIGGFLEYYELSYTFLDSKLEKTALLSRYSLDQLKHQFIAKAGVDITRSLSLESVYRLQQRASEDPYSLVDLKLQYGKRNFTLFALLTNLTATQYTETFGVPMPGRWLHVGAEFSLGL